MEKNRISVEEAAERMGVSKTFLREGLARDKFPFGSGYRVTAGSKRRVFYINRNKFENWLEERG